MKNKHLQPGRSLAGLIIKVSVLGCMYSAKLHAQCTGTNNFPTGTLSISPYVQTVISSNTNPGDYSIENFGTAGEYVVNASFTTFLTVTDNLNNPIASGYNPLNVTIPSSGNYRIHVYNSNTCGLGSGSRIVAVSPRNRSFSFDGTNDYIDLGTSINSALVSQNKITAEAWVYPTNTTFNGVIIGNYSTPANQMQFCLRRAGSLYQFFIGNSSTGGYINVNSAASVTLNAWQHVAGTWDGSVSRIYINGVLSGTTSVTYPAFNTTTNKIWLGSDQAGGGEVFAGNIDETRIWNRALCQAEIQNYMTGSIPTTANGLIANYHFDQGVPSGTNTTVTTLIDNSGSSFTGTVTNAALTGNISNWVAPGAFYDGTAAPAFVSPTVTVSGPAAVCAGNSVTLTASGNVSTYNWLSGPATATNVVTPTVTSIYSVTGTNSVGCVSNITTYTVTYNTTPTVSVNSGAICQGATFTMNPSGASTYTFQGGSAFVSPTSNSTYSVAGTSTSGCVSAPATSSVTVNSLPAVSVNSGTICSGNSFTIVPSGASTYTIQGGNAVVAPSANSTYSVAGTSSAGCVSAPVTSSVTVNITPVISVNSGAVCSGNSFTIVPSGAATYSIQGGNTVVTPTANATYSIAGSSTAGCVSAPVTSSVTVNPNPIVTAITSATNFICVGQTATLTAAGANTFTWNTTATTNAIAVSPTVTTSYTVTGTDGNGCVNSAVVSQSVSACTSINSVNGNNNQALKVFPNPSNGVFNIEADSSVEIELFDAQGKSVLKTKVEAGTFSLNINEKANGLYFLKATSNNQTSTIRLIKE